MCRAKIVADAHGLTFHGILKRTYIIWCRIEDYELRTPSSNKSKSGAPIAYLKIGTRWQKFPHGYKPYDALLERIAREAQSSKAQKWQLTEVRADEEWPKTFDYRDVSGWRFVGMYFLSVSALLLGTLLPALEHGVAPFVENITFIWNGLSTLGKLGFVTVLPFLYGSIALLFLTPYPAVRIRRRYLDQKFVATRNGFTFYCGRNERFVPWSEVISYHLETIPGNFTPALCVMNTTWGRFEFVEGISGDKAFRLLISEFATHSSTSKWRPLGGADSDMLGGTASIWPSGTVGVGEKVHHYRTRTTRAFLGFGAFLCLCLLLPLFTGHLNNGHTANIADYAVSVIAFFCLVLLAVWGMSAFFRASLQANEAGLLQSGVFGKRFIPWSDVQKFEFNGYWFTVDGRASKIRFAVFVADVQGLKDEIEARSGVELKNLSRDRLD